MSSRSVTTVEPIRLGENLELDLRAYELRRSGKPLKLERIPMELLLLLVEQRGQLVTREQILARIWGKDVCIEADNSINAAIRKIRQALRDDPERPHFVQTITGRGYRFIATVQTEAPVSPVAAVSTPAAWRMPARVQTWQVVVGLAVILTITLAVFFRWSRLVPRPQPSSTRTMLAVLPFENLTGDAGQDYLSDGLTEEMIAHMGRLDPERLGVIARTSVMHYKHGRTSLYQIGRELGVKYVLEGSVRRDGDNVRVTAQLIRVGDQTHLWAKQYDRELSSLLALQGEIAEEIADEIKITLEGSRQSVPSQPTALAVTTPEVYELYLKGRFFWNKRSPQGFRQAIECFQQAIANDPNYARAYAGLADSYTMTVSYGLVPPSEYTPKARAAAVKALAINDRLAEAHTSLAVIAQFYDWDWKTAEVEYRRAIELDPNYATAHQWYAEFLGFQGRFEQATSEMERARQLDPLSLIIAADHGALLYFSRQYDRAIKELLEVQEMEKNFLRGHLVIYPYIETGRFREAAADLENWRRFEGDNSPWPAALQVYVYGRSGDLANAQRALAKLKQLSRHRHVDPFALSLAYIGMSRKQQALVWLEKALAQRSPALSALKVDPIYDPLRTDPRFQDLLRHIGLM